MKKIVMTILFISLFLISGCDGIQNNSITSPIMDSYYITIDSDKYSLISGDSNDYIFTKSNKEIAKITYLNRSGALEYINLLKSSKDIKVLDIVPNKDKINGYYFFSKEVDSNHTTYNYILVLSHTGVLIENISSKAKAKKVSLNISVEETMCYEHHPHPIIPPIIIYS